MQPAEADQFRGLPAVTLRSGALSATFLPQVGMLGASLRYGRRELLSLHGGIDAWRAGHTTGMPLLAPWANRLGSLSYRAGRTVVDLRRAPHLHFDPNGLPIHGTLIGAHRWSISRLERQSDQAVLAASFDVGEHPDLMQSFPFPHRIEVRATVADERLSVRTTVRPTGSRRVPISFGWHPYYRLPGTKRSDLLIALPARKHIEVDELQIPTGELTDERAEVLPLASRGFDDGYALGDERHFRIESTSATGPARGLSIEFDRSYPFLQVYAPRGKPFIAIEPMTAATNALVTGQHPWVDPADQFSATFHVSMAAGDT